MAVFSLFPSRDLTNRPHIAGHDQNKKLAEDLAKHWKDVGLDHVTLTPYEVMLSYPNMSDLNYVQLLNENNTEEYKSPLREAVLRPDENDTDIVPPFNAYSGTGTVEVSTNEHSFTWTRPTSSYNNKKKKNNMNI